MSVVTNACTETFERFDNRHQLLTNIPGCRESWAPSHIGDRARYRCIIEGLCPDCGGALERGDRCGWCATCDAGWTYQGSPR